MSPQYDAVIVGAGFGGMGAAIQLKRNGYDDLLILERESDLGGTWHVNRYPGLAVDIPSSTYSYSFEPNPYWSRLFAPGAELKKYAVHVAEKYDLLKYMRFDTVVSGAAWDEDESVWRVSLQGGETVTATYLVTATGFLSQPKMPDIEGIDTFQGKVIHTTAWDDSYDLTGKRAAIIGTGATAVQLIPEVAKQVADLTVYQRTAIWVSPKSDAGIPKVVQKAFAALPFTQKAVRLTGTSLLELMMVAGVLEYKNMSFVGKIATQACKAHMRRQVKDPETRRKLTPDYTFGCKRPTFSNTYFPTFNKKHVHLETNSITRIDESGIVTADGNRIQPLGRELPRHRDHRQAGQEPRQVVARDPLPGLRGHHRPGLPQPALAEQPVLLQRPVLLHDRRVPDEAHGPAAHRRAEAWRGRLRGEAGGQRRVPRADEEEGRSLRLRARSVRHGQQLLLQPARRGHAAPPDVDDRRAP
jgi:cation diffusion facilitator CzcD-associated flavoprotein CzcO